MCDITPKPAEISPSIHQSLKLLGNPFNRKILKLPAEQKHALLQVAQTGDKVKTPAFIAQALQAGE